MVYLDHKLQRENQDLQRVLLAADGYLYLGLPNEALEELEAVEPLLRLRASVLRMRVRALLHLRQWDAACELSETGSEIYPEENEFMVQRAFALHQLRKGNEAIEVLLAAPDWLRNTGILHYNLACYEAQLGDLGTARQCIRTAFKLNSAFKKNARKDPDLRRLWNGPEFSRCARFGS